MSNNEIKNQILESMQHAIDLEKKQIKSLEEFKDAKVHKDDSKLKYETKEQIKVSKEFIKSHLETMKIIKASM